MEFTKIVIVKCGGERSEEEKLVKEEGRGKDNGKFENSSTQMDKKEEGRVLSAAFVAPLTAVGSSR